MLTILEVFPLKKTVLEKEMMKKLLLCILFLSVTMLCAQSIDKTVVASAGSEMITSAITINYTIGEPVVGLVSNESSLDQGFWAGSLKVEAITAEKDLDGIRVYPNPVENELNIFTDNHEIFGITLFGLNGQRVFKQNIENRQLEHTIDLSYLSKGVYVLHLFMKDSTEAKLLKVIKK